MATVTANQALPIPQSTDTPDVPRDFQYLAEAVEKRLVMRFTDAANRDAKILIPEAGMLCVLTSTDVLYLHDGATWVQIYPMLGQPTHSRGTTVPLNSDGSDGDVFFKIT